MIKTIREAAQALLIGLGLKSKEEPCSTLARGLIDPNSNVAAEIGKSRAYRFRADLTENNTYDGIVLTGALALEEVSRWDLVGFDTGGVEAADGSAGAGKIARGIITATAAEDSPCSVLVFGTVRNNAWNWTPGGALYLNDDIGVATVTQTAPVDPGSAVQKVGFAITADIAFFDFSAEYAVNP